MVLPAAPALSRRERQIMDALFELGDASARDIHGALQDAPSYSSVRAQLAILVEKGHIPADNAGRIVDRCRAG